MSIVLENMISKIPPGETTTINIYFTISGSELPYIVYYLKLNSNNEYDSFVKRSDFFRIYRSPQFDVVGIIKRSDIYYRLINVKINESLYKTINRIATVATYEIIEMGKCGAYDINPEFRRFFSNNDSIYKLYDDDDRAVLSPWVLYKTVKKKYRNFIEIYGFMRDFDDNMPYFRLNYEPIHTRKPDDMCVRIIVFMDDITLNSQIVSAYDIRENNVFIGDQKNCKYFGCIK